MEHLNYCRQVIAQFKAMATIPNIEEHKRATVLHVIDLCRASQKFILPEGGKLFEDYELRALDDTQPIRLPHSFTALEFTDRWNTPDGRKILAKRVLFIREDGDGLYVKPCAFIQHNGYWMVKREFFIPSIGYIDRSNPKNITGVAECQPGENSESLRRDIAIVLMFLNALACSNVHIERSEPRKAGKKIKAALPFDTYHVLTIDVGKSPGAGSGLIGISHRSPREHLRRGHIRRLEDGRRIWVNATVVAAGRGAAKVEKDYLVKNSRMTAGAARMAA